MRINRILLSAACIALLWGCQKETLSPGRKHITDKGFTFEATLEQEDEAKTTRDDDGKIYWTPGDAISVFFGRGTGGGSKFVANATEPSRKTNFQGTIDVVEGGDEEEESVDYFWAVYPYDEGNEVDGEFVTLTLPGVQAAGDPGTFAPGTAPSMARSLGLKLSFKNIWSGLGFSMDADGYNTLTIRGNNGEVLAGRAKIGLDDNGAPYVAEILDGVTEVTLKASGKGFEAGQYYYLQFFPQTLADGFTVEVTSTTKKATFVRTKSLTFNRSRWSRIKNLDTRQETTIEDIPVTRATFEDEGFADYIFNQFDNDGDGILSEEERNNATYISYNTENMTSARGIEALPNLEYLYLRGSIIWNGETGQNEITGKLSYLDVRANTKLRGLYCDRNNLTTLDVSNNPALERLYCYYNQLTALDVSKNTVLQTLSCYSNQLTSLDVSKNTELQYLSCNSNQLTSLDVSKNTALLSLYCNSNQISNLNLSANTELTYLDVSYNPLESFDISANTALESLECNGIGLNELPLSHLPKLRTLYCWSNNLTTLDLSNNPELETIDCENNRLTSLDFSANPKMTYIYAPFNQLSSINISACEVLTQLYCQNNNLETLDVQNCIMLERLRCNNNQLVTLNVSQNTLLIYLHARNNPMTTLYIYEGQTINEEYLPDGVVKEVVETADEGIAIDESIFPDEAFRTYVANEFDRNGDGKLSKAECLSATYISVSTTEVASFEGIEVFTRLQEFSCWGDMDGDTGERKGKVTSLDLSQNTELLYLLCPYNNLTELDLTQNTKLLYIDLGYNLLTTLTLPQNSVLETLKVHSNRFTDLDVSGLSELRELYINDNSISKLDLSNNPLLTSFECWNNAFVSLDLRSNTNLDRIYLENNVNLETVYLPETLTYIPEWAFNYCPSLREITLPSSLTSIGYGAFQNCSSLQEIVIPASVATIEGWAFNNCYGLKKITVKNATPPAGGENMFNSTGDCPIYVPALSGDAYKAADYWNNYAYRILESGSGDNEDIGYIEW